MIGTFVTEAPTEKALNASLQLINYIKSMQNNSQNDFEFITHDDAIETGATLCPGRALYDIWKEHDDFVNQTSVCQCLR